MVEFKRCFLVYYVSYVFIFFVLEFYYLSVFGLKFIFLIFFEVDSVDEDYEC